MARAFLARFLSAFSAARLAASLAAANFASLAAATAASGLSVADRRASFRLLRRVVPAHRRGSARSPHRRATFERVHERRVDDGRRTSAAATRASAAADDASDAASRRSRASSTRRAASSARRVFAATRSARRSASAAARFSRAAAILDSTNAFAAVSNASRSADSTARRLARIVSRCAFAAARSRAEGDADAGRGRGDGRVPRGDGANGDPGEKTANAPARRGDATGVRTQSADPEPFFRGVALGTSSSAERTAASAASTRADDSAMDAFAFSRAARVSARNARETTRLSADERDARRSTRSSSATASARRRDARPRLS